MISALRGPGRSAATVPRSQGEITVASGLWRSARTSGGPWRSISAAGPLSRTANGVESPKCSSARSSPFGRAGAGDRQRERVELVLDAEPDHARARRSRRAPRSGPRRPAGPSPTGYPGAITPAFSQAQGRFANVGVPEAGADGARPRRNAQRRGGAWRRACDLPQAALTFTVLRAGLAVLGGVGDLDRPACGCRGRGC